VPSGVSFETMTRTGNRIEIKGTSDSNNRLSDFMRGLDKSKIFVAAELSTIKSDSSAARAVSNFTLTFLINPSVAPLETNKNGAQ
jgi:type IV pilus assembly protein PilN